MTPGPDASACLAVLEATWPAARVYRHGPLMMRDGAGGGKRASAATACAGVSDSDLDAAEAAAARAGGARPLFRLCPDACAPDAGLDRLLASRGYGRADPTLVLAAPVSALADGDLPGLRYFAIWPPLEIQRQIWADAGIGAQRQAVMDRVRVPKTALLARMADRAAGVAFVACDGPVAMLHAMEVVPELRGKGAARNLLHGAAIWAAGEGARWLALAVTEANAPARGLYGKMGFAPVTAYHYRVAPAAEAGADGAAMQR
jgi:GNAT superfamily N-acetyltransferase